MAPVGRRVGVAAAAVGVVVLVVAGATAAMSADAVPSGLPASLHGAVETKALTAGTGLPPSLPAAGGLLLDPGPAYAYATVDRDQYPDGAVSHTMTARGANLDPGTIAAAALWVAPVCEGEDSPNAPCVLSGQVGTGIDTGLEYAKGWPGYAEALFPDQPGAPSQQTVYKCVVNKDANGGAPTQGEAQTVCKSGGTAVPLSAWAEAIGAEVRATGFSRSAGMDIPGVVSMGASESLGDVRPQKDGLVRSYGYSTIKGISLLGGQITIDAIRSVAEVVSGPGTLKARRAACTFTGLTVAGEPVSQTSGGELPATELQPLLDAVFEATQIKVEIIPPKPVRITTAEGGKHVAECSGMQINLVDTREQLVPVCAEGNQCIPPLGLREELLFGRMSVLQSVNAFAAFGIGGADETLSGAVGDATAGVGGGDAISAVPAGGVDAFGAPALPAASGAGGATAYTGSAAPAAGVGPPLASNGVRVASPNLGRIGALAVGASGGMALCVWLLIAVVGAIARGTPLRAFNR